MTSPTKCQTCGSEDEEARWKDVIGGWHAKDAPAFPGQLHSCQYVGCQPCSTCSAKKEITLCVCGHIQSRHWQLQEPPHTFLECSEYLCGCKRFEAPCKLCGGSGRYKKVAATRLVEWVACPNGCKVPSLQQVITDGAQREARLPEWKQALNRKVVLAGSEPKCLVHGEGVCKGVLLRTAVGDRCYLHPQWNWSHFLCGCAKERESGEGDAMTLSASGAAAEQAHRADLQNKSGMGTAEVSGGVSPDSSLFAEVAREVQLVCGFSVNAEAKQTEIAAILSRRFGPVVEAGKNADKATVDFLGTSTWVRPERFKWPDCRESEKIAEVRRRQETRFVLHGAWIAAMKKLRQALTDLEKK